MSTNSEVIRIARSAKKAAVVMSRLPTDFKNKALLAMADELINKSNILIKENVKDLSRAVERGIAPPIIERLTLKESTIKAMANGIREVASLPDPVGEIESMWRRPNGLLVGRMRIPLGVIGIIYESRPNVTADAASLCIKSGNAVILRGGSEAINSNVAIAEILRSCLKKEGLPEDAIGLVQATDREAVREMLKLEEYIDLIIPRGGEELIKAVVNESRIPVIKHYKGVCHIFIDESADLEMSAKICINAKTQRPSVCNAMETLLVHENIAAKFLPNMAKSLREAGVLLKGCNKVRAILPDVEEASESDWYEEYLDLILSIRIVAGIDEAIEHIEKYGSFHTESIITNDYSNAQRFLNEVNSSTVLVNASTRFSDGFELGLGAEIGISTTKLHAFGPMGLKELTTTKFIIYGNGQVRT